MDDVNRDASAKRKRLDGFYAEVERVLVGQRPLVDRMLVGLLTGGHLTVDMTTLRCTDIADPAMNAHLIAHLKSDDFFSTEKYPNAKFNILTATVRPDVKPDEPNYQIRGDFTLKGVTKTLDLSAVVARRTEGAFTAQARLDIDRTLWGAVYGSAKFFGGLGQHLVNDVVHVYLKVVTKEHPVAH